MKPPMMVQSVECCAKCGRDYTVTTTIDEALLALNPNPRKCAEIEHAATVKRFVSDHEGHQRTPA